MTFDQYYDNPLGKNSPMFTAAIREGFKQKYEKKWGILLIRENRNITRFLYHDQKHNAYYAHFRIPSETVRDFYYDVVIKFTSNQHVASGGTDLFKYDVQFYSNDPAFCYTWAYAFNEKGMFIKELSDKMIKECLRKKPVEKNPNRDTGYVKTIVFAYLYMKATGLNKREKFNGLAATYSFGHLSGNIEEAGTKVRNRQDKTPEKETKKEDKPTVKEKPKNTIQKGVKSMLGNVGKITPKSKVTSSHKGIGHFNNGRKK